MFQNIIEVLTDEEIKEIILDYDVFLNRYQAYNGTNIKNSNKFLNEVLSNEEKEKLYILIHSKNGWYSNNNGYNSNLLRITAYSLGLTHSIFSYNNKTNTQIISETKDIDIKEQDILLSAYLKQKLVTFKTLESSKQNEIILFRGLRSFDCKREQIVSSSLESWTSNLEIAKKFSNNEGFILKMKFNKKNIFSYFKSIFKQQGNIKTSAYISRESEWIVENKQIIYDLEFGNNIFKCSDLNDN